jgi:hypothetical protein
MKTTRLKLKTRILVFAITMSSLIQASASESSQTVLRLSSSADCYIDVIPTDRQAPSKTQSLAVPLDGTYRTFNSGGYEIGVSIKYVPTTSAANIQMQLKKVSSEGTSRVVGYGRNSYLAFTLTPNEFGSFGLSATALNLEILNFIPNFKNEYSDEEVTTLSKAGITTSSAMAVCYVKYDKIAKKP